MKIRFRALAALLLVATAATCGDSTLSGDEGALRFDYSGALSGSFDARGTYPDDRSYAEGFSNGGFGTGIHSALIRDGLVYQLYIQLPFEGSHVGRHSLGASSAGGAFGHFSPGDPRDFDAAFIFVSGTLDVTRFDDERVRGRFEGTVQRGTTTIQIRGGTFDVPVVPTLNIPPWRPTR